jgi:hypothetical protein
MKRALLISISTIVAVWLADKGVAYVVRIIYRSYKNLTNSDVVDLLDLKYGLAFVINVFVSMILYFVLRKHTSLNKIVRIALCVAIFTANFLFFRNFRAWR